MWVIRTRVKRTLSFPSQSNQYLFSLSCRFSVVLKISQSFFKLLSCAPGLKYLHVWYVQHVCGMWEACVALLYPNTKWYSDVCWWRGKQSEVWWILFASAMNSHFLLCLSIVTSGLVFHTVASPLDKKHMHVFYRSFCFSILPPQGEDFWFCNYIT